MSARARTRDQGAFPTDALAAATPCDAGRRSRALRGARPASPRDVVEARAEAERDRAKARIRARHANRRPRRRRRRPQAAAARGTREGGRAARREVPRAPRDDEARGPSATSIAPIELAVLLAERLVGEALRVEPARIARARGGAPCRRRAARGAYASRPARTTSPRWASSLGALGAERRDDRAERRRSTRGSLVVHTELGRVDARLAPQLARLADGAARGAAMSHESETLAAMTEAAIESDAAARGATARRKWRTNLVLFLATVASVFVTGVLSSAGGGDDDGSRGFSARARTARGRARPRRAVRRHAPRRSSSRTSSGTTSPRASTRSTRRFRTSSRCRSSARSGRWAPSSGCAASSRRAARCSTSARRARSRASCFAIPLYVWGVAALAARPDQCRATGSCSSASRS